MGKHLDNNDISRYVLNEMSPAEETLAQEHLSGCGKCRKKLEGFRTLLAAFSEKGQQSTGKRIFLKIYHNPFVRAAALIAVVAGVGFAIYDSRPAKFPVKEGVSPENVLSVDSLPAKDSIEKPEVYCPEKD